MPRRSTIGDNPLDAVIPNLQKPDETMDSLELSDKVIKERITIHLPVVLINRVKNAVYWTPGMTLARLAEDALSAALLKMEQERGDPFPQRREELKGGRPLK